MAETVVLNSVDELATLALKTRGDDKYLLHVRTEQEYIDLEAGRQYEAQAKVKRDYVDAFGVWDPQHALRTLERDLGHEPTANEIASYTNTLPEGDGLRESLLMNEEDRGERYIVEQKNFDQWCKAHKPPMRQVTYYRLETAGSTWHSGRSINVGADLGAELVKIWKHGPIYKGSSTLEPKGYVTLAGICKRLGKSDIGDQIKSAQDKALAEQKKNSRNYTRRQIKELLEKIEKIIVQDGATIGLTVEMMQLSEDVTAALISE